MCRYCRISDDSPHLLSIRTCTGDNKHQNHTPINCTVLSFTVEVGGSSGVWLQGL